jgi:zinc transport system substrate-binding protein
MSFSKYAAITGVSLWLLALVGSAASATPPKVLVTVRPIHSLVAAVMGDIAQPGLLLTGSQTPHSYTLVPSDAKFLSAADLVIWVGEPLETFLEGPLETLSTGSRVIELASEGSIRLRENRDGGVWETGESGHSHESHDEGAHDHHEDHGKMDGHIWLDPRNSRAIVEITANALSMSDPNNAELYQENAAQTLQRLDAMEVGIRAILASVQNQPFLVAHDALQYFDTFFGLNAIGAIAVTPDQPPSARRLSELRQKANALESLCLFTEPGFAPKVMSVIADSGNTRPGVVDPLGINIEPGHALYFDLMEGLARDLAECLGQG